MQFPSLSRLSSNSQPIIVRFASTASATIQAQVLVLWHMPVRTLPGHDTLGTEILNQVLSVLDIRETYELASQS